MNSTLLPLAGVMLLPGIVVLASFLPIGVERLRRIALIAAGAMLLASLAVAMSPEMRGFTIRTNVLTAFGGSEALLRVDALSSALLPFAAGLWLLTAAVTPRASLDRGGLRRTALATLLTPWRDAIMAGHGYPGRAFVARQGERATGA